MKRTFPANIDGQIFYIDEDAFTLLNNYLDQLRQSFTGPEGTEIVNDIESRIREHFEERIAGGAKVIVLSDVNKIIETMGSPEEISACEEDTPGNACPPPPPVDDTRRPFVSFNLPGRKRLYRNGDNKVFGGVFGGLACYLGWNANIMRLLYAALTCATYFWPLTILYLILWMIIPVASTPRQILEMKGEPVNVGTVGQAVMATAPTPPPYNEHSDGGFWSTFFGIIGKGLMIGLGLISLAICMGCLIAFLCVGTGVVALVCFNSPAVLTGLELYPLDSMAMFATILSGCLFGVLLFGAIAWGAISVVFHTRGLSKSATWTVIIVSIMLLVISIICGAAAMAA